MGNRVVIIQDLRENRFNFQSETGMLESIKELGVNIQGDSGVYTVYNIINIIQGGNGISTRW